MKILSKVLWAIDFNTDHENLIPKINKVINEFKNEIVILHVLPSYVRAATSHKKMIKSVEYELKHKIARHLQQSIDKRVKVRVEVGGLTDKINLVAREENVNFVIVNKSLTGELGSNGIKILRYVEKPLVILTNSPTNTQKHIVCAVDSSETSAIALKSALLHTRKIGGKLSVISVFEPPVVTSTHMIKTGVEVTNERERNYEIFKHEFDKFLADFDFSDIEVEKLILQGHPEEEIIKYTNNASVLYHGNSSKRAHQRFFMGSVSEGVIRKVKCMVVVVKTEGVFKVNIPKGTFSSDTHLKRGKELIKLGFIDEAITEYKNGMKETNWS